MGLQKVGYDWATELNDISTFLWHFRNFYWKSDLKLLNYLCFIWLLLLPGKFHGQGVLVGYSLWGHKRVKYSRCKRRRFDPWVRKIPLSRKWQSLQYSCLENSMNRGAWQATVHGVEKSQTWLSNWTELNWHQRALCLCSLLGVLWFQILHLEL